MIKAIFWDNDGVLVDTEILYLQATRELLQTAGVTLTDALFKRISLAEGKSALDLALQNGASRQQVDRLHAERNLRYNELLTNGVRILDGVEETLARLDGRVLQAIVTSSRRLHFDTMHAKTGLLPRFGFVLAREDYRLSKPDPEPYRLAVTRSGLRPEECVAVEDSPRGLRAAVAAGLRCIVVPNALTMDGDFEGAWRILGSCREIPALIESESTTAGRR